jgi:hypothetical protein
MRKKRQQEKKQKKEESKRSEIEERQRLKHIKNTIQHVIETLDETDMKPQVQIERIVNRLGPDFAMQKLQETDQVEAQGGLKLISNPEQRRTRGGVFFFLVKKQLKEEGRQDDVREIFNRRTGAAKARKEVALAEEQAEQQNGEREPEQEVHTQPAA